MKVVVLGGAGDMGSEAVRDLNQNPDVEKVIIADFNLTKAKKLADDLGEKCEAVFVNADDEGNLIEVIKKGEVVLSCIGPFYKYEKKIASSSIKAGVNYLSICDDFDAVEDVLTLDEMAKEKNITVLTGVGWTPGMSNILALKGMQKMDKTDEVNISWAGDAEDSEGLAVIKHTYHIFTGKIKTYIGGEEKVINAGTECEIVEFLPPIGKIPVYHLGHPEPVTMPKFIPQLKTVTLKGGLTPPWLNVLSKALVAIRLTDTPQKIDRLANITKKVMGFLAVGGNKVSGLRVDVKGEKEGKRVHYVLRVVDNMRRLTGIPAAIGAAFLGSGKITKTGVVAPEICFEPDEFILELQKRNIKVIEEQAREVEDKEVCLVQDKVKKIAKHPAFIAGAAALIAAGIFILKRRKK